MGFNQAFWQKVHKNTFYLGRVLKNMFHHVTKRCEKLQPLNRFPYTTYLTMIVGISFYGRPFIAILDILPFNSFIFLFGGKISIATLNFLLELKC